MRVRASESVFLDVKTNIYFVIFDIVVKNNIDNDTRHHSGQNVVRLVSPQQIELHHKARALL